MEQPLRSWMTPLEYREFSGTKIEVVSSYARETLIYSAAPVPSSATT
jgi:hypothetical protein